MTSLSSCHTDKLTSFCSSWFSFSKKAVMTNPVLRHNCILGPFRAEMSPSLKGDTDESLHAVSIPYSAMPCNMLRMKLRMPSQCFPDSVLAICRRSSVYTILLQASDMGCGAALSPGSVCAAGWDYHLQLGIREVCELVSFRSGNRTATWSKISHSAKFSAHTVQGNKTIPPSLAHLSTFIIKLNCMWLHVCNCMFCCKCFNTSAWFCLGVILTEVGKKIFLPEANVLKWLFFLSSETAFCLLAVKRWSQRSVASAHKPLTFNFSCKQNTEITG